MPRRCLCRLGAIAAFAAALLAGCGGGGDDADIGGQSIGLPPSWSLAQVCAAPRPAGTFDPITGRAYGDIQGTLEDEKAFLRAWLDETYLWYQDLRALPASTLDPAAHATPLEYFDALRSPLRTPSGKDKDGFHFTYETTRWVALSQSGVAHGYGFQLALLSDTVPRHAVVAFTEPGTPAAANGIARGAVILTADGIDVVNGTDSPTLNEALFPTAAGAHTFTVQDLGSTTPRTVTLTAQALASAPVQHVGTLPAPHASVGYVLFNDHVATSEAQLVAAVEQLRTAGIGDLVLDIRYNGGGYLDIAAELAYMIAGPATTGGKVFERLVFNDRRPFGLSASGSATPFHPVSQGFSVPPGRSLPTLNLSRVFVLTSADTCSASEAVINGLRGAGVTVHQIGGTTCGKPYGFFPRDNCGTTYFAIHFQGVNHLGFGDYADGLAPTCAVADDFTHPLGDPAENQLEVALGYIATGTCTEPIGARPRTLRVGPPGAPVLVRPPTRENRLYRR